LLPTRIAARKKRKTNRHQPKGPKEKISCTREARAGQLGRDPAAFSKLMASPGHGVRARGLHYREDDNWGDGKEKLRVLLLAVQKAITGKEVTSHELAAEKCGKPASAL